MLMPRRGRGATLRRVPEEGLEPPDCDPARLWLSHRHFGAVGHDVGHACAVSLRAGRGSQSSSGHRRVRRISSVPSVSRASTGTPASTSLAAMKESGASFKPDRRCRGQHRVSSCACALRGRAGAAGRLSGRSSSPRLSATRCVPRRGPWRDRRGRPARSGCRRTGARDRPGRPRRRRSPRRG